MSSNSLPNWVMWVQALAIPVVGAVIAGAGVMIAWQQKRLADLRLQNDLYDRRFKIYAAAKKLLFDVQEISLPLENFVEFARGTADAEFLLTKDVIDYLATLRSRAAKLRTLQGLLTNQDLAQDRGGKIADEIAEIEGWFFDQFTVLADKFRPAMRLDKHLIK